ncbi:MAG: flippase-like domain-containing protein [Alphaproteobacteria bacterium]|nr:flippase-like domain-containing protein [Alphaproteobacteria bacterium]
MNQKGRALAVFAVTAACLVWALWGVEIDRVRAALGSMQLAYVPLALAVITGVFLLRVLRFQLLLGDARPSFGRQVVVCGIAFLGINVVPLRLGELVRSFMLLDDDVSWGTSLGAVVMERVVDLFCLLGMLLLVSVAVDLPATVEVQGIDVLPVAQRSIAVGLAVLMSGLVALGVASHAIVAALGRVPIVGPRLATFATSFRAATAELASRPGRAAAVSGLAVLVWAGTITCVWLLLSAFPGLPATWEVALAVTAFTVTGTVALPTPGFFGPFEVFCKAVLVLWSVEPTLAATFAIVWHLHQFGFHLVTGMGLLVREGLSLTALVRASLPD